MADEPLIQDITTRIMADESRHVAFGVLSLEDVYKKLHGAELREREDFVIEATHLHARAAADAAGLRAPRLDGRRLGADGRRARPS